MYLVLVPSSKGRDWDLWKGISRMKTRHSHMCVCLCVYVYVYICGGENDDKKETGTTTFVLRQGISYYCL